MLILVHYLIQAADHQEPSSSKARPKASARFKLETLGFWVDMLSHCATLLKLLLKLLFKLLVLLLSYLGSQSKHHLLTSDITTTLLLLLIFFCLFTKWLKDFSSAFLVYKILVYRLQDSGFCVYISFCFYLIYYYASLIQPMICY